ncbi:MAG: hypothetical protein KBA81_05645 [Rhabdochlamydiaceae bacterium]|nr:hypothetical protein [Rhabdochlamydiaceae bacterium]
MSTKMKAFIGIVVSFAVLIILFTSNGGYRASRDNEQQKNNETCSVIEKVASSETIAQAETK